MDSKQEVEDLAKAMMGRMEERAEGQDEEAPQDIADLLWPLPAPVDLAEGRDEEVKEAEVERLAFAMMGKVGRGVYEKLDLFAGEDKSPEMVILVLDHHFEAAHRLPGYNGKCAHLHGHSYRVKVTMMGKVQENGMVLDFAIVKDIIDQLDHQFLNDLMENPTVEITARWLLDRIPLATEVELWEGLGGGHVIICV